MDYIIMRPQLPPKAGYVEVIDENGNHIYKPTPETEASLRKQADLNELKRTTSALIGITPPETAEQTSELTAAVEFNHAIQLFAASIEDESTMMEIPTVYPEYKVGVAYKTKDIFRYGTNSVGDPQLYQVLQDHTSAAEWTPDTATSLYKKIGVSEDGTPIWVQPLGATDAYNIGDQVMYNGKKYESLINANVWSPDAYPSGWRLVEDTSTTEPTDPEPGPDPEVPTPEPEEPETVPDFVQPTGAHDAYKTGDRVKFTDGHIYESTIDNNVWSPSAYPAGWKLVE